MPIHEARNHAVAVAQGQVAVFLHARLEVLTGWLEPILTSIVVDDNWNRVAVFAADETGEIQFLTPETIYKRTIQIQKLLFKSIGVLTTSET